MRGNPLPFDVDMDLVDSAEGSVSDFSDENKAKQLFPVGPDPLFHTTKSTPLTTLP